MNLVSYANLPPQYSEPRYGLTGTLLGWGRKDTNGPIEPVLQEVDVVLFTAKECQQRLGMTLHLSHICSGKPEEHKGQCTVSTWTKSKYATVSDHILMTVY